MIIQTGMRTDIPAFYSEWFANRLREGYVLVRNPYSPRSVTRYELNPSAVDMIGFCTKNPTPMIRYMNLLNDYNQYWFVTITPYGRDIEPNVPAVNAVIESFKRLSDIVGTDSIVWRYDPIIVNREWTVNKHIEHFKRIADSLAGYTDTAVISFIDLYSKVLNNYAEAEAVPLEIQLTLTKEFVKTGMTIKPCGEDSILESAGADCSGCMTVKTFERAIGQKLNVPPNPFNRKECACYLTGDIGAYNTCGHFCRYCYANVNKEQVKRNMRMHDPKSPFLIGDSMPGDIIYQAKQISWIDSQLSMEF